MKFETVLSKVRKLAEKADVSNVDFLCKRQVLFPKFRHLIFPNPRQLRFHSQRHFIFHTCLYSWAAA